MLYNPSCQDELEHSEVTAAGKNKLYFCDSTINMREIFNSLTRGRKLDNQILEKIQSEIISNRLKVNPLKSIKEEKANSDILFANPQIITMNPENTKKLLEIKENQTNQDKISNFYVKNQIEQLSGFSEYLYFFSLINKKSTLNENEFMKEIEKSLKSLNTKISESKELLDNFFKLIPILEQFTDINLENLNIKLKFLKDITINITPIIESSDLILIKMNETLHNVLRKIEKLILNLEQKLLNKIDKSLNEIPADTDISRLKFERQKTDTFYRTESELKIQLLEVFNFIFSFSVCFKFSYGFFLLAKYIKKFNFEFEFRESFKFSQLRKIGEKDLFNGSHLKDWEESEILHTARAVSYENQMDQERKKNERANSFGLFECLPKITSHCKFGNNWFFYNNVYGLIRFIYNENTNKMTFIERNSKAFDLERGFLLPIGSGDSGLICHISDSLISNDKNSEKDEQEEKRQKALVQVLFSDHINYNHKESFQDYEKVLKDLFSNLKEWLENSLNTFNEKDEQNFVYTEKKIKIPYEHIIKTRKNDISNLLSKVIFHSNNNLIYCFRPILNLKKESKNYKTYFSQNFIYAIDIFEVNLKNQSNNDSDKPNKLLNHVKSCLLTNKNEKYLHESDKECFQHIELFLDNMQKSNLHNLFVNAGKLFILSSDLNVFVYDLIFDSFELTDKIIVKNDEEESSSFDFYFLTKNNCLSLFKDTKSERYKGLIFYSVYKTKLFETNLPINFAAHEEALYYELSQMENLNMDMNTSNQRELNNFLDLNLNFKNSKNYEENDKSNINLNESSEADSDGKQKIALENSQNINKGNSIVYILGNLALGAIGKFNEKNFIDIEKVLATDYFSYNDRKNLSLLFELIITYSDEIFGKEQKMSFIEFNEKENYKAEENALILFSLLNLLKLHIKNNSRLGWEFGVYFNSQESLQETIKHLFEILYKVIQKNFSLLESKNDNTQNESINKLYENISFLLLEILFETIAFNITNKNYFVNIFSELLIEIKINELKFSSAETAANHPTHTNNNEKKSNNDSDLRRFLFNINLKLHILNNISKLFSKNSNYIIAFLINEYSGNFIFDMFKDHLEAINKNLIGRNPNGLSNINLLNYNNYELKDESLKIELYYLNLEKILSQILTSIYVKYMNSILNFGKKPFNQNLDKIIQEIYNTNKCENEINEIRNKLTNFVIEVSRKFFESGLLLVDYIKTNNIKMKLLINNFLLQNINNILNFINLINFENFPDFILANWYLILNILNGLSNFLIPGNYTKPLKEKNQFLEDKDYKELISERQKTHSYFKTKANNNEKNLSKIIQKFDLVFDNFKIDDTKQKSRTLININLEKLIVNKKEIEDYNPNILTEMKIDIHLFFSAFFPFGSSQSTKTNITIKEKKKQKKVYITSYCVEKGLEIENYVIKNVPITTDLIIEVENINYSENESQNMMPILFKLRLTNYKFFDRILSYPISVMNTFINKTIKFLSFYENANLLHNLNVNEEVKEVISSSIFSGGIKDCKKIVDEHKKLNLINKDLETFFFCLDDEHKKKLEFLNDQSFDDPFNSEYSKESFENKKSSCSNNLCSKPSNISDLFSYFINNLKSNKLSFENLICIKDMDLADCENSSFSNLLNLENKEFYLLKKLFILFDFLIEKVNREYIVKGPISDKLVLGLFFVCIYQDNFIDTLEKTLEAVFLEEDNFNKFTGNKLDKEDCVKLLENKNFEEVFFIWKNCCQIRKIFKSKKDLIFQQMDENYRDKKINLEFDQTDIELSKINCNIDPNEFEDKDILKYFERYLQKIKLIFYLKSNSIKNSKASHMQSFTLSRSQSGDIIPKSGLLKKNSLYLQSLMMKSLKANNFEDKTEFHHKEKAKIKDLANNLISAISNDKVNVDNILACLQSLNVKIKFREISLFIVNEILKNFKNCEIKADLISNFYHNFKQNKNNQLPNVLDNLNTTSTEQSEIITNLFQEYLFNLIEEINAQFNKSKSENINSDNSSLPIEQKTIYNFPSNYKQNDNNSIFYLIILLNNLIWNIKGRNFQFLLDIQFFQNLFNNNKNEKLKIAKNGMFLDIKTSIYSESLSIANSINYYYDITLVSTFLTDIFNIYSNLIIKRILKENIDKTPKTSKTPKGKGLGLSKSMSNLDHINNSDLVIHMLDIYQMIIDDLLENTLYKNKKEFNKIIKSFDLEIFEAYLNENEEHVIINFYDDNLILLKNLFFSQKKIWNISISLLRLIIIQDPSIEFIFRDISLFSKFLLLVLFANEKNIYIIFGLMKIIVSNLNKNSEDFEYFGIKLKDLYKNYILPYKKISTNYDKKSEDLLAHYKWEDLEKLDSSEFFIKFILTLKLNSSKLRVNKDLLYFDRKLFKSTNNFQNIIESSIEDRINEFLRFFLSQSGFKENCINLLSSIALENGTHVAKVLDSNIGYLNNFCKIICNTKIDFNQSNIDKIFDTKDVESLVKKGTLIYDKSIYYLNQKASEEQKNRYEEIHENTTEDCIVRAFMEDNSNIINQIETNKPNLLFPYDSEYIVNEEYIDSNSLIFADKILIQNSLKYLKENLIEKNAYSLNHLQSYIRIIKFLKKISLISSENLGSILNNNPNLNNFEEEELNETAEANKNKVISHLEELKKIIENFFEENKEFFEYFLVYEKEKLPANIININKLENLFFSYTPYDLKMISKNKSENLLNFEDPKKKDLKNLFPFGEKRQVEEEINTDILNDVNNKKNLNIKLIEEIKDLYLSIKLDDQSFIFKLDKSTNSDNILNMELKFKNYSYIFDEGDDNNNSDKQIRRLKKPKQIEIYDKKKALEIIEDFKNNEESKPNRKKKKNIAIFLTDEFLKELDLDDPDKLDVNQFLGKYKAKDNKEEEENEGENNKDKDQTEQVKGESKKNSKVNSTNISRKNSNDIILNGEEKIEENKANENVEIKEESKEINNENFEIKEESKECPEETQKEEVVKTEMCDKNETLTEQKRHQYIFEKYIHNNYFPYKCVFFVNDIYFNKINKNFSCFSVENDLLENDIRLLLESPTDCCTGYQIDGKNPDPYRKFVSIFYYLVSDISRFFVTSIDSMNNIKQELKELAEEKENRKHHHHHHHHHNKNRADTEKEEEKEGIFEKYLQLIDLELRPLSELKDIKISDPKNFETIFNETETIPFENQKEADIKNLGMHILKQHLRFLCLISVKKYAIWEEDNKTENSENIKTLEIENKFESLLKYFKLLFYQSSFKENYFNLKLENRFITSKISLIVNKIITTGSSKNIRALLNTENTKIISLAESIDSESAIIEGDQILYVNEIFKSFKSNEVNYRNKNTQKSLQTLCGILLNFLHKEIIETKYLNIINLMNIMNSFINIILAIIEKNKDNVNEDLKEFLTNICLEFLKSKSIYILMQVKSNKKNFSSKILEFILSLLRLLYICNDIIQSFDLNYKIKSLNKNFIDLYESLDIVENKFKSKIFLDKIIKDTEEFQESVTKKFRMPNIKNSFCFTLRDHKFKTFDITFQNAKEKQKECISLCELLIKKNEDAKENEKDNKETVKLSYDVTNCLGDSEYYDYLHSTNISAIQSKENNDLKKYLIYSDNTNNMIPKNYVIIKDEQNSEPTIYNLPSNISNIYNFREDRALVMKQGNKLLIKGTIEKEYKNLAANEIFEEITKNETIVKIFDNGIIITNKNIHVFAYIQDYIESRYKISDSYKKFPLGPIKNAKNISWAHVDEYGIVLLDTDGQIYSAGKYYFGPNQSTSFEYNYSIIHNTVFGKKKCRQAYVCYESSVFLIEEDDGKLYLYGSGYNCSNIGLVSSNNSYIYTGKIEALAKVPLKKLIVFRCNVLCISEKNDLYYCGFQRDYYFSDSYKEFYVPKLWEWPNNNNYSLLDVFKSSKETVFVKLKNNQTGKSELFMFGQIYLFNEGTDKFIWYDKEPHKIDLNKLVDKNKQKLHVQSSDKPEEKKNPENDNLDQSDVKSKKDSSEKSANTDNIEIKEEEIILNLNENTDINIPIDTEPIIKDNEKEKEKEKNNEKEINQETIEEIEEEFIISRYELNKKANKSGSDEESEDSQIAEEGSDSNSVISEESGELKINKSDKNSDFTSLVTETIKQSYKLKEIKAIQHGCNKFRLAAMLGYEPIKRDFNLKILENKMNSIISEKLNNKENKNTCFNIPDQKYAICVINNKNNILRDFVFAEIKSEFVYLYLSIMENSESYLISPYLFKTKKDLLDKTNFKDISLLEEIEKKLSSISSNRIKSNMKVDAYESLMEFSSLNNINLDLSCFEYINHNYSEISNLLFLADNLLIYKNQVNEFYFEKESNNNLIDLNQNENTQQHLKITIKCTDINIDKIYPYLYEKAKKILMDNYIKNLKSIVLREYCDARTKFSLLNNDKKSSFTDYLLDLNRKSQKFLGFFDEIKKVEFVQKVISILEQSMISIIDVFDAEIENRFSRLVLDNIFLVKNEIREKAINDEIGKLSLNDYRRDIYVDRMSAKKFQNSNKIDKKFETTVFSQVYREMKKKDNSDYYKVKNSLLFRVNLKGENATDAGGPAREIFTMMFEDLMSKRLDLFIPTPNQQAAFGLGRDLWTINPDANSIYHLDCFEFIGKVFAYSIISKVYCPINLPNFVWKLILNINLKSDDLEEIDVVAYNSIVKPCLNPDVFVEELFALFDYATFTATLSNGEEIELIDGGRNIKVCKENYEKFIELYLEARFREVKEQAQAINKGIK